MLTLDHLAVSTLDLKAGADAIEAVLGVPLEPGGNHAEMGTHNRLLSLGAETYLEVIAIEPGAQAPSQPRWFDLDNFTGETRLTNWIARSGNLDAACAAAPSGIGVPWALARGDFRWRMAVPRDGKLPFDGLFPALIEWQGAAHPAPRLPDRGVRLLRLVLHTPDTEALRAALSGMITDGRLSIRRSAAPHLSAEFDTPNGPVRL
ncbi:MAG: VOC family protein [Pseudomonadota bacterium]